jgi:predicted nucleic-acid-binding Zn-ribbon protein
MPKISKVAENKKEVLRLCHKCHPELKPQDDIQSVLGLSKHLKQQHNQFCCKKCQQIFQSGWAHRNHACKPIRGKKYGF